LCPGESAARFRFWKSRKQKGSPPMVHFPVFPPAFWNAHEECVKFLAGAAGRTIRCCISREALCDHFGGASSPGGVQALKAFHEHRPAIEAVARSKILVQALEPDGTLRLCSRDFE
jgi:hypothetical protein